MSETTVAVEEKVGAAEETVASIGTKKQKASGNIIFDIAQEVESLTKVKALNEASKLAENVEVSYFRLGGVLKLINDNSWYEGYTSFDAFVVEKYGFQGRKARYLISIYDNLVTKQIDWEKVKDLGWTKLKDLALVLTPENVDEWVAKAKALTVSELQALLKPVTEAGDKTQKTSDEVVKVSFKLKPDQADLVTQALAKAKGELHTEFDTVAIENICAGYLGGVSAVAQPTSFEDQVKTFGFEASLEKIANMYPDWNITANHINAAEAV